MKHYLLQAVAMLLLLYALWRISFDSTSYPPHYNPEMTPKITCSRPIPPGAIPLKEREHVPIHPQSASTVFEWQCAICHGVDGKADTYTATYAGMPTVADLSASEKNDDEIRHDITHGRGAMPAFGKRLSPQEIETLIPLLHSLRKP